MTKPKKERHVNQVPFAIYFKPQGVPMFTLEQVILNIDEYEAIRLADKEEHKHDEAAKKMKISRPTFTRVLNSAHKKIADALVNGKAIKIEGGNFVLLKKTFYCRDCHQVWTISLKASSPSACPECQKKDIIDLNSQCGRGRGHGKGRKGWRHRNDF